MGFQVLSNLLVVCWLAHAQGQPEE